VIKEQGVLAGKARPTPPCLPFFPWLLFPDLLPVGGLAVYPTTCCRIEDRAVRQNQGIGTMVRQDEHIKID